MGGRERGKDGMPHERENTIDNYNRLFYCYCFLVYCLLLKLGHKICVLHCILYVHKDVHLKFKKNFPRNIPNSAWLALISLTFLTPSYPIKIIKGHHSSTSPHPLPALHSWNMNRPVCFYFIQEVYVKTCVFASAATPS